MQRIAVVGAGISGLAAAYYLSRRYEVWLFEREDRLGGHTHTIDVETPEGAVAVDTGFIVYNERTYPHLTALFRTFGLESRPTDMSFSVSCPRTGLEYSSRGLGGFFADRRTLLSGRHVGLLADIVRFGRRAPRLLDDPTMGRLTLGDYLDRERFGETFRRYYLYPMASAVWSMAPAHAEAFPASTLVRFFERHGMLGVRGGLRWRVLRGGSRQYLAPLTAPYRDRIHTSMPVAALVRGEAGVEVRLASGTSLGFDEVVLACHGPEALALLSDATPAEREILGQFQVSRNDVLLHTDTTLLPRRPSAHASWNYRLTGDHRPGAVVTYDLNRLQGLALRDRLFVTLNANGEVRPETVLRRLAYAHPLYTMEAVRARERWREISGHRHTHFCGAYWFDGFHEDGLNSARRVARALGVDL